MGSRKLLKIGLSLAIALVMVGSASAVATYQVLIPKSGEGKAGELPKGIPEELQEKVRERMAKQEGMKIRIAKIGDAGPIIPQSPETTITSGLLLENPEGKWIEVNSGDVIPVEEYYNVSFRILNPTDEPAVIEPEIEIYKVEPAVKETLYYTSFEDPGKIYEEWMQMDFDSAYSGYYDSWSWTDARATDGSHSMKCTQFDQYLNAQEDYLVKTDTIDVSECYAVNVTWDIWVKGEYDNYFIEWWSGQEAYTPIDYVEFMISSGDPHDPANWYYLQVWPGPVFFTTGGIWMPGSYYFMDTELALYDASSPDVKGYYYIAEKIPGKPGWWHCWANVSVDALYAAGLDPTKFSIVFGWHSDIQRTFEGAYIDNVKIEGIKVKEEKIYQGHSQEWKVWEPGEQKAFKFPLKWAGIEPGYYKAVMKIKNSEGGYDDLRIISFKILNYVDCAIERMWVEDSFTGEKIPNGGMLTEGADAHIISVYHQKGNVPVDNVPITATAYKVEKKTLFFDDFEGGSAWHGWNAYISTDFAWSGTHSLAFNDPKLMRYKSGTWYIAVADAKFDVRNLEEAYVDYYYIAVLADSGDIFFPAFVDWDGSGYIIGIGAPDYGIPYLQGPLCQTEWIGPMQPACTYMHIDLLSAYHLLADYLGYFRDANGRKTYTIGIGFWLYPDASGTLYEGCADWSGVYIDDVKVTAKVVGDAAWQDIAVIDHAEPGQCIEVQFEWENVPFSEYKIVVAAGCPNDVYPEDNVKATSFKVMTYLERMTEKETYQVDLSTCTPKAWCISPIHGYSEDDSYALATNCETHEIPYPVNDFVALAPGKGSEAVCCPMCIDISHIEWPEPGVEYFWDFETACPDGWTIIDGDYSGYTWECSSSVPYWVGCGGGGVDGTFMLIDDDAAGSSAYNYDDELISPAMDFSTAANVYLDFDGEMQAYAGSGDLYVYVSNDGGSTWNLVAAYYDDICFSDKFAAGLPIDITAYAAGYSNVMIKFVYTDEFDWAWGALIDNVKVYSQGAPGIPLELEMNYTCDMEPDLAKVVLEVAPCEIPEEPGCGYYTLALYDTFGDGWDYGYLDVYINGELEYDHITLDTGFGPAYYKIFVMDGDHVDIVYHPGIWYYENYYMVLDEKGNVIGTYWYSDAHFDVSIKVPGEEKPPKCACPSGVTGWIPVAEFTGHYGTELQHFKVDLRNYLPRGTTHMCLRFRLDTTPVELTIPGPIPGTGFEIHDIRITNLLNVTKPTDSEPVFEDFYDDFEDGYLYDNWCVDCVHYGCNWTQIGTYTWFNAWPAEPVHNALVWSTELHADYEAYLDGRQMYTIGAGTVLLVELSDDGGNSWYVIERVVGPASTYGNWIPIGCTVDYTDFTNLSGKLKYTERSSYRFDLSPWAGKDILIRARVINLGVHSYELWSRIWLAVPFASAFYYLWHDATYSPGFWMLDNLTIIGKEDYKAPVSTATLSGDVKTVVNNVPKYAGPVTVTITASDDVAMGEIHYILDGTEHVVSGASATFTVSEDGTHTVEYWAVDAVGNEETPHHTLTFAIDLTPPTVEITAPGTGIYIFGKKFIDWKSTIIIGGFTAEARATDDEGVKLVKFYIDDNLVGATDTPTNGDIYSYYICVKHMGAGTLKVVAEDVVGNTASASMDITYFKFF